MKIIGENRSRSNKIIFYLSDEELNLLEDKIKYTNHTSRSDFIRDSLMNNMILVNDYKYLRKLINEVNKIGTNINQIAKVVNMRQEIYKNQIEDLKLRMDSVWKIVYENL